eukprot:GEMP01053206.1.p1 GENE.GEMP01053206.1~~GEMP01053206.1.p1  ORF type:complete len:138 (+),score=11.69 GEMP01053206.1:59-472(+)
MEDLSYMNMNMNMNGDMAGAWQDRNKKPMNIDGTKLFVGNLPFGTSDQELKEVFGAYGEVVDTMLLNSKATSGMHCAFVFFRDGHAAQTAINVMHNNYRFGYSARYRYTHPVIILLRFTVCKPSKHDGLAAPLSTTF